MLNGAVNLEPEVNITVKCCLSMCKTFESSLIIAVLLLHPSTAGSLTILRLGKPGELVQQEPVATPSGHRQRHYA